MSRDHTPNGRSPESPQDPTVPELALVAAQLLRPGSKAAKQMDAACKHAAETAYRLWSACDAHIKAVRNLQTNPAEKIRRHRLRQLAELRIKEPATYPIDLRQFLTTVRCPGRSHTDRLAKFRAWVRAHEGTEDVSMFTKFEEFFRFSAVAVKFRVWLKAQRSEAAKRARTPKSVESTEKAIDTLGAS